MLVEKPFDNITVQNLLDRAEASLLALDDLKLMTQPNCSLAATTGTSIAAPCVVGQDDTVDCRVCKQFFPNSALCEP